MHRHASGLAIGHKRLVLRTFHAVADPAVVIRVGYDLSQSRLRRGSRNSQPLKETKTGQSNGRDVTGLAGTGCTTYRMGNRIPSTIHPPRSAPAGGIRQFNRGGVPSMHHRVLDTTFLHGCVSFSRDNNLLSLLFRLWSFLAPPSSNYTGCTNTRNQQ